MVLLQEIYKNGGTLLNKTIHELDYELNDGVYFPFLGVITTSSWDLSGDFIRTSTTENTYTNQYDPDGFQYVQSYSNNCVSESNSNAVGTSVIRCSPERIY